MFLCWQYRIGSKVSFRLQISLETANRKKQVTSKTLSIVKIMNSHFATSFPIFSLGTHLKLRLCILSSLKPSQSGPKLVPALYLRESIILCYHLQDPTHTLSSPHKDYPRRGRRVRYLVGTVTQRSLWRREMEGGWCEGRESIDERCLVLWRYA